MPPLKIIVGLGNPGQKYEKTRHNAGFLVIDALLGRAGGSWQGKKFDADWSRCTLLGQDSLFLKPQTYMNLSGRSVAAAMRFFKAKVEDVIVLHDDIDVPFGKVKARIGGGHGGHNGIRSLLADLGGEAFSRIKLGVGRPSQEGPEVVDWVLSEFTKAELDHVAGLMVDESILRIEGLIKQATA